MRRASLFVLISLLMPAVVLAQAAPAGGSARIAVIDFQRAMTENTEGKKTLEQFSAEVTKRQTEMEEIQRAIDDMQNKLRTQDKALSDAAKADLTRQVDLKTTEFNRKNEDAQKDLGLRQQELFRPIGERVSKIMNLYASEAGLAVVLDVSSQASNVIYAADTADITTEIIRRVDADATAKPAAPAARAPSPAPAAPRPPVAAPAAPRP